MKKTLLFILKLSISSTLIYIVLKKAGPSKVGQALMDTGATAFLVATALFLLMVLLTAIRWGLLLRRNLGWSTLMRLQMLGTFFNTFLPGLVGGDAVKVYYMYKQAGMGAEAVASVFMDRYLGYAALMLLGLLAYPFGMGYFSDTWITWLLPALVAAFAISSVMLFGLEMGKRFESLRKIYGYFRIYLSRKPAMAKAVGLGLMVHSASAMMVFVLSRGMGEDISLFTLLVFIPIISTLAALPLSLGGIGIREAAMVLLLGTLGISPEHATALSFLWYFAMVAGGALCSVEYIRDKDYIKEAFSADTKGKEAGKAGGSLP